MLPRTARKIFFPILNHILSSLNRLRPTVILGTSIKINLEGDIFYFEAHKGS